MTNENLNHKGSITLETERLYLKKLKLEDAEQVYRNWTNDDEVSKYMRWETHKSVEDTKKWIQEEEINYKNKDYYCWGIVLKETNELIGSLSAFFRSEEDNRYEIGYGIGKKYWKKGYTTEAVKCMMDYLINNVKIKRFSSRHAKENPASGAVMKKVGFRYVSDGFYKSFDGKKKYECKKYYLDV